MTSTNVKSKMRSIDAAKYGARRAIGRQTMPLQSSLLRHAHVDAPPRPGLASYTSKMSRYSPNNVSHEISLCVPHAQGTRILRSHKPLNLPGHLDTSTAKSQFRSSELQTCQCSNLDWLRTVITTFDRRGYIGRLCFLPTVARRYFGIAECISSFVGIGF
jgi:hypothetical protein